MQSSFDLRSPAKRAVAADPSPGLGLFDDGSQVYLGEWQWNNGPRSEVVGWESPSTSLGMTVITADPKARLSLEKRNVLTDALGLSRGVLPAVSLGEIMANYILGALADPTGLSGVRPLRMGDNGVRFYLGSFGLVWEERFSNDTGHPNYQGFLDNRWIDYRRHKAEGFSLEALQKWTDFHREAYKLSSIDALLPTEYLSDGSKPHSTTWTENWPTNSSTISTGQDEPWTEDSGDLEVSSNKIRSVDTTAACGICDTALSTEAHSHTATAVIEGTDSNSAGIYTRIATGGSGGDPNNAYGGEAFRETGFFIRRSVEYNSGTRTNKASDGTDPGSPITISCTSSSGDSHDVVVGAFTDTFSDSTHSNLLVGLRLRTENTVGNATLDAHTATDLAALGRLMSSLVAGGGLAGIGGIAGRGGGLAG